MCFFEIPYLLQVSKDAHSPPAPETVRPRACTVCWFITTKGWSISWQIQKEKWMVWGDITLLLLLLLLLFYYHYHYY